MSLGLPLDLIVELGADGASYSYSLLPSGASDL